MAEIVRDLRIVGISHNRVLGVEVFDSYDGPITFRGTEGPKPAVIRISLHAFYVCDCCNASMIIPKNL